MKLVNNEEYEFKKNMNKIETDIIVYKSNNGLVVVIKILSHLENKFSGVAGVAY
jgi:hypothetical protein